MYLLLILACTVIIVATGPLVPMPDDDAEHGLLSEIGDAIATCASMVDDPLELTTARVHAHLHRGVASKLKSNRAPGGFTHATRLAPGESLAYIHPDGGTADLAETARLAPTTPFFSDALRLKGFPLKADAAADPLGQSPLRPAHE
jgi:hypothetical protein